MVMSFRVSELQVLLGFAGRNKSGRKHELLAKALHLLKSSCAPSVQMKIKELYRRRFPRKTLGPSDLSLLSLPPGTPPVGSPGSLAPIPPILLAPGTLLGPKREVDVYPPLPQPVHPDVTMKPLPFYEVYGELIRPTTLASTSSQRFEEAHFTFALTPQQVQQILTSREVLPGAKCDYTIQVQLRFCLCETSCPQEDCFPPNLFVKVNGKLCPLPGYLPPTKNGAEPKRPSRPINITPLARLSATVPNTIVVNWSSEFGRNYSLSVYLVRQLTAGTLLQKLRAKGIRNPDHSRALIKEKLTADPDSEVATTSLRVSLMCPLGKMRLTVPCRALTCAHLQSFDAALYLQMNEKKPTWTCPVCDKKAPYESLIIDGLFMDILNSCSDCDEIQFMEDGSWCPMKPKKEASEVCPPPGYGLDGLQYSPVQEGNPSENKKKVEVIDLTIESSSDEEDLPPTKKHCPVTSAAILALPGSKGVLTSGHQPSSVLRSPAVGTLGRDFLSSLPLHEYPPAFPLGADIQGLDLFSFLHTESQEYICPRCESGFIEEVTDDSSFLVGGGSRMDNTTSTHFAEFWRNLDHAMIIQDFRPFLSSSPLDQDNRATERPQTHTDFWGPNRPPRLPATRRYRSQGSTRPDRSPAIEGIIQQIFAGFFANSAVPGGSPHPFTWSGMLHSNPGDYAWGQTGLDAIVTQLLGQLENTGPPPADKEKITSLPTVTVTQEQVDTGLECPVCKEDYTVEEEVRQLPCNHFFHSSCIVPWLELHDACPICRKSLNGEDSTWQTQNSEASASNRFSSDSQLHDRWTF